MGFILKTTPIGVDIAINDIIESMYPELIKAGWTNYEAYHRAYKNPIDQTGTFVPEVYTAKSVRSNEYKEVLMDDKKVNTSFFITGDSTEQENGNFKVPISIIFQLNSKKLYPNFTTRADEEARNDAMVAVQNSVNSGIIVNMVTSIPVVYAEFNTDKIVFTDMSPMHVFRINLEVLVDYSCGYRCTFPGGTGGYTIIE